MIDLTLNYSGKINVNKNYNPRILFDDLLKTSDNIIIGTACLGGIINKGNNIVSERYIKFLEDNQETNTKYKSKLRDYNSKTHMNFFKDGGWVYEKCKQYICTDRIKIAINPYEIEDFNTAVEYIRSIPKDIRDNAFDVKMLMMKFPELQDVEYEQ